MSYDAPIPSPFFNTAPQQKKNELPPAPPNISKRSLELAEKLMKIKEILGADCVFLAFTDKKHGPWCQIGCDHTIEMKCDGFTHNQYHTLLDAASENCQAFFPQGKNKHDDEQAKA